MKPLSDFKQNYNVDPNITSSKHLHLQFSLTLCAYHEIYALPIKNTISFKYNLYITFQTKMQPNPLKT